MAFPFGDDAQIYDLLADRKQLVLREDAEGQVQVVGLVEHRTRDPAVVQQLIEAGQQVRRTSTTQLNADSSRSHALLVLSLRNVDDTELTKVCNCVEPLEVTHVVLDYKTAILRYCAVRDMKGTCAMQSLPLVLLTC